VPAGRWAAAKSHSERAGLLEGHARLHHLRLQARANGRECACTSRARARVCALAGSLPGGDLTGLGDVWELCASVSVCGWKCAPARVVARKCVHTRLHRPPCHQIDAPRMDRRRVGVLHDWEHAHPATCNMQRATCPSCDMQHNRLRQARRTCCMTGLGKRAPSHAQSH
jgi:hypothetical protein